MKWDFIIQNPPYNGQMHLQFALKGLDLLSDKGKMTIIEPATWLISLKQNSNYTKPNSKAVELKNKLEGHVRKVIIENFNKEFGIANKTCLSVAYVDNSKHYNEIEFINCGDKSNVKSLEDCNHIGNRELIDSILNKCLNYKDHMIDHCINISKYKDYEEKEYYFMPYGNYMINSLGSGYGETVKKFANGKKTRNGHYRAAGINKFGKYYDCFTLNGDNSAKITYNYVDKGIKRGSPRDSVYGSKEEIENWKYYQTNNKLPLFLNICLTIDENNNTKDYIPWLVGKKYTDEEIYNLLNITKEEQDLIDKTIIKYESSSDWCKRYLVGI